MRNSFKLWLIRKSITFQSFFWIFWTHLSKFWKFFLEKKIVNYSITVVCRKKIKNWSVFVWILNIFKFLPPKIVFIYQIVEVIIKFIKIITVEEKMKFLLYWKKHIQNSKRDECQKMKSFMFRKYFPKYIEKLSLNSPQNLTIISKMKVPRRIHHLARISFSSSCSKLMLILGNKVRFIKYLDNDNQSLKEFPRKIKLFSSLEHIKLELGFNFFNQKPIQHSSLQVDEIPQKFWKSSK